MTSIHADATPRREPPDGTAWREAQRSVAERNDQASKAARQQRDAEQRDLAMRRAERERGQGVYR
jgi:hypothetical protein